MESNEWTGRNGEKWGRGMDDGVIAALRRAVASAPDDVELAAHLAEELSVRDQHDEAIGIVTKLLATAPENERLRGVLADVLRRARPEAPVVAPAESAPVAHAARFDWSAAERQLAASEAAALDDASRAADVLSDEVPVTRLSDVAGMSDVKRRIEATFLVPARNPELREMYAASLRGGLLLYGPPGCGKTFLARALAGELGANFFSASITDILDPYVGASERNLHDLFVAARASSPAVVFFDEIDTLGQRRSSLRNAAAMRNVVNQLLIELDGVDGSNEGIYVLAASNQPWDIDPALHRPGRFDRTVFVGPPDAAAREAIFVAHLRKRPIGELDVKALARATEGLSGADIAFVCSAAAEAALMDSVGTGRARPITMDDLRDAIKETPASIGPWLDTARNIVTFSDDGTYADVKALLRRMRRS